MPAANAGRTNGQRASLQLAATIDGVCFHLRETKREHGTRAELGRAGPVAVGTAAKRSNVMSGECIGECVGRMYSAYAVGVRFRRVLSRCAFAVCFRCVLSPCTFDVCFRRVLSPHALRRTFATASTCALSRCCPAALSPCPPTFSSRHSGGGSQPRDRPASQLSSLATLIVGLHAIGPLSAARPLLLLTSLLQLTSLHFSRRRALLSESTWSEMVACACGVRHDRCRQPWCAMVCCCAVLFRAGRPRHPCPAPVSRAQRQRLATLRNRHARPHMAPTHNAILARRSCSTHRAVRALMSHVQPRIARS